MSTDERSGLHSELHAGGNEQEIRIVRGTLCIRIGHRRQRVYRRSAGSRRSSWLPANVAHQRRAQAGEARRSGSAAWAGSASLRDHVRVVLDFRYYAQGQLGRFARVPDIKVMRRIAFNLDLHTLLLRRRPPMPVAMRANDQMPLASVGFSYTGSPRTISLPSNQCLVEWRANCVTTSTEGLARNSSIVCLPSEAR